MAIGESPKKLRVAVVGGGPGGLATAIVLQDLPNVQFNIYEKASVLREVGAAINVGQNTWNVLDLLRVGDALTSGQRITTILNMNGKTGEEVHRRGRNDIKAVLTFSKPSIRTQMTKLQSVLLSGVREGVINLRKGLIKMSDLGDVGIRLRFADGTETVADLVVGADGIRSVVRDSTWKDYELKFTGTTIWRVLLPITAIKDLDPRFLETGWWHSPTTHVYFSPVGEGLWEIAARAWQDPEIHKASKKKVVLVGDSSHTLSGAFGSGAGFAIEDGWILARALEATGNDIQKVLPIFNKIRLPYYSRMYAHLDAEAKRRAANLGAIAEPSYDDRVRNKIIKAGGQDTGWIYDNNTGHVWEKNRSEVVVV